MPSEVISVPMKFYTHNPLFGSYITETGMDIQFGVSLLVRDEHELSFKLSEDITVSIEIEDTEPLEIDLLKVEFTKCIQNFNQSLKDCSQSLPFFLKQEYLLNQEGVRDELWSRIVIEIDKINNERLNQYM